MNDDFLTRFHKEPPREFAATLYQRINTPMNKPSNFAFRRATVALALCVALIAVFASSQTVRAALQALMREIGGITYIQPEESADEPTPPPDDGSRVREDTISFSEMHEKVPFEISLPVWVPDSYEMSQTVRLRYFDGKLQLAFISWWDPNPIHGPIELLVGPRMNWAIDLSHLQEVQINGQPAGLSNGAWDADTGKWGGSGDGLLTLTWMRADLMYQVRSFDISQEELIRVAESIP